MTIGKRRLSAIVLADVVGYSRLMGADESGTLAALRAHRSQLIDPLIGKHGGRIVKTMGDGILLEFSSVVEAVKCSTKIQIGMLERNAGLTDVLRFRIGIHLGDVIVDGDDILGDGVNVAARIEAIAEPDSIAISDDAYRQVRDRLDVVWQEGGEHKVKNIARAISVWRWSASQNAGEPPGAQLSILMPPCDKPSIAVLPFDNMSGDQEQEYFADGITEDIITELSKLSGLMVISRNSTFTYKNKATKTQEVCSDLGVRYVLEGSVRKAGERVRINAQLIEGNSGGHLWAERYDRELTDIFALQDDVTEKIVSALQINLVSTSPDHPVRMETTYPEAYDCVLRGREQFRIYSKEANRDAQCLFENAIKLDPEYAAAYAGLAQTFMHDWFLGSSDALDRSYKLALKANSLNPSLPIVYDSLGNIYLFKRQHKEAIAAAEKWIDIEPNNADAHANLAGAMMFCGQPERTIPLIDKAMRLNPFYPFYYMLYKGQAGVSMEKYDEALEALKRSIVHNSESMAAHLFLAACLGLMGKDHPAGQALTNVHRIFPDISMVWVRTFLPYKQASDLDRIVRGLSVAGLEK
jgi:adenylate cyclase